MGSQNFRNLRFAVVLAGAAVALAACGSDDGMDSSESASTAGAATGTNVPAGTASALGSTPVASSASTTTIISQQTTSQQTTTQPTTTKPTTTQQTSTQLTKTQSTTTQQTTTSTVGANQTSTGTATLDWTPPTENTDGTVLTNLAGYKVYYGTAADNLSESVTVNNAGLSSYTVTNLASGTWYFAVAAVTTTGTESAQSSVVSVSL